MNERQKNLEQILAQNEHKYYLARKEMKAARKNINEIKGALMILKQIEKDEKK
ncbi:MAG: hypothetical protein ACLFQA_00345 [Bacteroidales bacterium]